MEKVIKLAMIEEEDRQLIKMFTPSKLYYELRWKYIQRHLRLPVLIGVLCWLAYLCMEINALAYEVTRPIIQL